ncbi:MAG: lipoprotein [Oceanicaulis sp. HLUCCA04]|nr:MAG: lipoprotein [Oceanicaulis sp. HLUCCA04]
MTRLPLPFAHSLQLAAIAAACAALLAGCASMPSGRAAPERGQDAGGQSADAGTPAAERETYDSEEIAIAVSDFFGVTAEAAGVLVERIFADLGEPVGYIIGEEASGAMGVGLRYGQGDMVLRGETGRQRVFWQGPSVGFDAGGNASRVFTLIYNLDDPDRIYQRFPGVEGTAYFVAGMGVNYQRADYVTLAPIRSGVGFRAGANVGYLAYSRQRNILPF